MKNKELLLKVLSLLKPYKLRLFFAIISLVTVVCCLLSMGWIIRNFVDSNLDPYGASIKYLIFLIITFGFASFLRSYLINSTAEYAANDAKRDAYYNLLLMNSTNTDNYTYSDLSTRINSDTEYVAKVVTDATSFFIRNIMTTVGGIVFMFLNSIKLSFVAFTVIGFITFIATRISKQIRALVKKTEFAKSKTSNLVLESIINGKVITAFASSQSLKDYFIKLNQEVIEKTSERLRFRSIFFASVITLMLLTICAIIWYGSILIKNGEISSGTLSSFLFYTLMTALSFGGIIEMLSEFEKNLANCERVFEIFVNHGQENVDFIDISDGSIIEFKNINYSYKNDKCSTVLSNFSEKINLNEFTVITGQSGKGKTTILNLIMGIYSPDEGEIKVGTHNLKAIMPINWNKTLAYVPQDNMLFSGSIADNIAFFDESYDENRMNKILEGLELRDFIKSLADGINSEIGSLASKISGGQKQRIAIARALYRQPKILILDESTSQLDENTEHLVLKYIKNYMKGKAIICVAHRRGAINEADRVLSL